MQRLVLDNPPTIVSLARQIGPGYCSINLRAASLFVQSFRVHTVILRRRRLVVAVLATAMVALAACSSNVPSTPGGSGTSSVEAGAPLAAPTAIREKTLWSGEYDEIEYAGLPVCTIASPNNFRSVELLSGAQSIWHFSRWNWHAAEGTFAQRPCRTRVGPR